MQTRVITIRYDEQIRGFPEDAINEAANGREVVRMSEHFFVHKDVPYLVVLLLLADAGRNSAAEKQDVATSEPASIDADFTDEQKAVYEALKSWRISVATQTKKPAYAIAKNTQLSRIVKTMPQTIKELKVNAGMSDAFCDRCGEEVLDVLATFTTPNAVKTDSKPWWKLGG